MELLYPLLLKLKIPLVVYILCFLAYLTVINTVFINDPLKPIFKLLVCFNHKFICHEDFPVHTILVVEVGKQHSKISLENIR